MITLIRSNSIVSDPRVEKYITYLVQNKINYKIIAWDRLGENLENEKTIYFRRISGYSIGGFKAAYNRIIWMHFVLKTLINSKEKYKVIHGCDLDGTFPAIVYKILFSRNTKVIFDIFDWYSATLGGQNIVIKLFFKAMEFLSVKISDEIIICEPERIEQIPYKLKKKECVLPNIPSFDDYSFLNFESKYTFDNDKKTIAYVGGFYKGRFLIELLDLAATGKCNLLFAGYGDRKIEEKAKSLNEYPNIKYFGKVNYQTSLNIMYNADLIYAMYNKSNKNHIYAAPNKYYEAMLVGKPLITNDGTILTKKVRKFDIGFIVSEDNLNLADLIESSKNEEIVLKGEKASMLWNKIYKYYTKDFLNNTYSLIIKQ